MFVTKQVISDYDIGVGDEVFMIGRFINHEGKQKNMPSVRFGNISIMPIEPILQSKGYAQESYAVEMRSVGGFSGSPVFVRIPRNKPRPNTQKRQNIVLGSDSIDLLLGIDWGHIRDYYPVKIRERNGYFDPPERLVAVANTYMSGVIPAWKLLDILNTEKLRLGRQQYEEQVAEHQQQKPTNWMIIDSMKIDREQNVFTRDDFLTALSKDDVSDIESSDAGGR